MCSAPKIPKPPTIPKAIDPSVLEAKRRERSRATSRQGVRATLLSDGGLGGGAADSPPKTLLGY